MSPLVDIRPMRSGDIAAGMRLKSLAGWNQVEADWRIFLGADAAHPRPEGCFVAVHERAVVGTVTTIRYGRDLAWISMLLVDPPYRGQGIGTRLMQAAIAGLAGCPTIMLDATPAGQALYKRLGFRERSRLLRLATDRLLPPAGSPSGERLAERIKVSEDLDQVVALDRAAFGAGRAPLLRSLACRAPEAAWVLRRQATTVGLCLGRDGAQFRQLGPLAAETLRDAGALCRAGLAAWQGRAVVLDVPASQETFRDWLCSEGFAIQRPFTRMLLGEPLAPPETPIRQFAICGPEFG